MYDKNNRLITETKSENSIDEINRYYYDNNGNQTCKTTETLEPAQAGVTESYSAYVLEANANPSPSPIQGTTLNEYNGFNQLKKSINGNIIAEYQYNADGLRSKKTTNGIETRHIWDGQNIAIELVDNIVAAKYVRGINLIRSDMAGTVNYYLFNGHGDVVQLTNSSGNVIKTYDYDAFGNEKNLDANDGNPFRYCGEYFDKETGTYYLRARYYNPVIGRFITEDSYLGKDSDPLSLNLYVYCGNNPIIYIDPTGFAWTDSTGRTYCDVYVFIAGKERIERANSMSEDPSFYNITNWITDGILEKAVDVVIIEEGDKWYQTTLDTFTLAGDLYGRYATVKFFSKLVDKAGNAISSLFNGTSGTVQTQYAKTSFWERLTTKKVSVDKLVGNVKDEFMNPKIGPSETALSKHINYIKQNGTIDEPILVKKLMDGTYEIQNGHHRWLAALKMGFKDIPVEVMK